MVEKDAFAEKAREEQNNDVQSNGCKCCGDSAVEEIDTTKQLEKAMEERNDFLLLSQRIQADFENYKKRNRNAISDACQSAILETVERFIPVLDNIERALESGKTNASSDVLIKGVDMVAKQFRDVLKQLDVQEIEALHKEFTPELHEALLKVEVKEAEPKNIVTEVLQKGYKCKDKVIRHSMVKVSC